MVDYLYSVAIQANSFHNNMADKTVWRINEYSLYYTGTQNGVLITEVSSIQSSPNTLQYYTRTQNGVLVDERFVRDVVLYIIQ